MEGAVGLGDRHHVEDKEYRGQSDCRVPYPWTVHAVHDPEKILVGGPCEDGRDQAGESKLEKSSFYGKVGRTRFRMQESIKGIGKLRWEALDGTDANVDGKAFWQAGCHGAAVKEKEQDK
ncbi:MAG: hypothetical protein K2M42_06350 [Oscillospiraceae bacterium]|nr:hypothetical protein [Oscillospiraceae bacterium]